MLYRPLYRGEIVWNRSQRIVRGGTKKQRRRPENDWLRLGECGPGARQALGLAIAT